MLKFVRTRPRSGVVQSNRRAIQKEPAVIVARKISEEGNMVLSIGLCGLGFPRWNLLTECWILIDRLITRSFLTGPVSNLIVLSQQITTSGPCTNTIPVHKVGIYSSLCVFINIVLFCANAHAGKTFVS